MKILVTGVAGFVGFHLINYLIKRGDEVIGLDNINDYYDVNLKYGRLKIAGIDQENIKYGKVIVSSLYNNYKFIKVNLEDKDKLEQLFDNKFDAVCNLAAQPGIRYSLENPDAYIQSNIVGFINILECCRNFSIKHFVFASSSSVYGLNEKMPYSTSDSVNHPISLYAATKKSNELMAHTYSYLFNLPTTGLRFFTVYGPWGRPDMAIFLFAKAIYNRTPIQVYNNGAMKRDFTFIDDIIEGITRVIDTSAQKDNQWNGINPSPESSIAPFKIYNIGNGKPIKLLDFINALEERIGIDAIKVMAPLQAGDVLSTYADTSVMEHHLGYKPSTDLKYGVSKFINWYCDYYKITK
jgi:UDP-glucuronate 4-epimerase